MKTVKPTDTPVSLSTRLVMDDGSPLVQEKSYWGMIGSVLYLTASRPNICFSVGLCARFQSKPKESHLKSVKRIFRYLNILLTWIYGITKDVTLTLLGMLMLTMQASWLIEKTPQVWVIFLDPVWYLGQPRNIIQLPYPQ